MDTNRYLDKYYADNGKKIRELVDKMLKNYGGLSQKDYDDFYSLANEVFTVILQSYDETQDFDGYLYSCLQKKVMSEITTRNRIKRQADRMSISLDTPLGEENEGCIADTIQSDFSIERELENRGVFLDEKVEKYLKELPNITTQILIMKINGYSIAEIKGKLKLSNKEYDIYFNLSKKFECISILLGENNKFVENKEDKPVITTQTAEKSKPMQYSIASIIKKIKNRTIRFDHPLQRESDQWSPAMKGNLISDILQGNPLPEIVFAEQIVNGIPVVWDLDGKQRCTNCYSYANDGFKISKNIRRWNIQYLAQIRDEDGNPVLDENEFPISEYKEFDIRNKKFSQLPPELQEKFLDYTFKCDQYLNCDSDEIAYHIIRYNEGKSMNASQKGIIRIGEEFATLVKSISAMPFFRDKGGYKISETKNGTLERVVVESVMASKYLEEWNKSQEAICEYLKNNAKTEDFENFEDMVSRLEEVITDGVADMFDSKDSFLWFGLFARFIDTGEEDEKFVEFMAEFSQSLHSKVIDGMSFDDLCIDKETGKPRATKDKYIVVPKMILLEKLMNEFLFDNIKAA